MKLPVLVLSACFAASTAYAAQSRNYDAFRMQGGIAGDAGTAPDLKLKARQRSVAALPRPQGYASHYDSKLGSPTFLWAATNVAPAVVGPLKAQALPEARARSYLNRQAAALGLSRKMVADAALTEAQDTRLGTSVARFAQKVNGIEVFNRNLNVLMDREGRLVATSGSFHPAAGKAPGFTGDAAPAIAAAIADLGGHLDAASFSLFESRGAYQRYALFAEGGDYRLLRAPRAKPVYYPSAGDLVAAWYVEIFGTPAGKARSDAYAYVISAATGAVLFRKDLTAHETYSYRVFADADGINQPYDAPLGNGYLPSPLSAPGSSLPRTGVAANLVTLDHGPISTGDPWLAAGATTTTGNNVDAFLDSGIGLSLPLNLPVNFINGYVAGSGDLRTTTTGANSFDWPIAADDDPAGDNARNAAVVNLFYLNNWLHDFWYDHGFNEAAGNAQSDNYDRGGETGDPINAHGQDASGRNNANMATPADGSSPTMQMYLFNGALRGDVRVLEPEDSGSLAFAGASFGPQTFDVTASVGLANDLSPPVTNGCDDFLPIPDTGLLPTIPGIPDLTLLGKIALVDRGDCNFTSKAAFAMLSGAVGLAVVNNGEGSPGTMGNADIPFNIGITTDALYWVPSVMIRQDDGQRIKDALAAGEDVRMQLQRLPSIDYDGTLDNQIIAHEFFHYVSNRLVGNASGLSNNQGGGMGEGWSDVASLILAVRPDDRGVAGNEFYQGAYPTGFYVIPDYWFGIRRAPYSTDFAKNALSFQHIQDGVPLPETSPFAFGQDGATNSEVHNTGEVWANMLWEVYAALLNDPRHSFEEARSRMMDYTICGLKLTPSSPTFTEARDGILACAKAADEGDFNSAARAFARRGIGVHAVSPDRDSSDNAGVVESYVALQAPTPAIAAGLAGEGADSCDRDGVLDVGETGQLRFTLRNNGAYAATDTITGTASAGSGLTLANGGQLRFTPLTIGETAIATLGATLADGTAPLSAIPLTVTLDPPGTPDPAVEYPPAAAVSLLVNYDVSRSAQSDTFENRELSLPDWTRSSSGTTKLWEINDQNDVLGSGQAWYAPDEASATNLYLETPAFNVPAGGEFSLAFDHYYEFEVLLPLPAGFAQGYDGGVIEVSVDGGAWTDAADFGASFANGYSGRISALDNRDGYTGSSDGVEHEVLDFGNLLAGHSARIRFHVASDELTGAYGWAVDNVTLDGTAEPPFNAAVAEDGVCLNNPPLADAGADFEAPERSNVVLDGNASDADGDTGLVYAWTQVSGPAVVLEGADTLTPNFEAVEVTADTVVGLRLTVTDEAGDGVSDEVQVTILNVNRAPVAQAGADFTADERSSVLLAGNATDPDGDIALSYAWTQIAGPAVALSGADTAMPSFAAGEVSADVLLGFRLTVTDASGASGSDEMQVTIRNINRAPTADAGADRVVDDRSNVTLQGGASDADGAAGLSYAWTQIAGPAVTLSGANTPTPSFATGEVTAEVVLGFRLTVTDPVGASGRDEMQLTIRRGNRAPSANAGPDQTVTTEVAVTLDGLASTDPEGDALSYAWTQISGVPVTLVNPYVARTQFGAAVAGDYVFELTVTDGDGAQSKDRVGIEVLAEPDSSGGGTDQGGGGAFGWIALAALGFGALLRRRRGSRAS